MKKNNKIYMIIIAILVIYLIVFFVFSNKNDKNNNKLNNYINLIIGNDAQFLYENSNWKNVSNEKRSNYNWYLYNIYENNDYLGKYYLIYSGEWNLFDKNKNKVNLSLSERVGIDGDLDYKVIKFDSISNNTIDDYVKKVLNDNSISSSSSLTTNDIISIDIDNDNILERLYIVSNVFSEEEVSKVFGFIFLVDDNNIYMIYQNIFEDASLSTTCKPYISNILEVSKDKYIVVNCSSYSDLGKKVILYRYKNNNFKEIISN